MISHLLFSEQDQIIHTLIDDNSFIKLKILSLESLIKKVIDNCPENDLSSSIRKQDEIIHNNYPKNFFVDSPVLLYV